MGPGSRRLPVLRVSPKQPSFRPGPEELAAAVGRVVPDVIAPDLDVLFCGINPGLWTAAVGHHFARPGNRFWKALHQSGFTPIELSPYDERALLPLGLGVTNLVATATRNAAELDSAALRGGAAGVVEKVARWRPRAVAFLGMAAFRKAFARSRAAMGEQPEGIGGSRAWLLPNPSGLQARYQLPEIVEGLAALRDSLGRPDARSS